MIHLKKHNIPVYEKLEAKMKKSTSLCAGCGYRNRKELYRSQIRL